MSDQAFVAVLTLDPAFVAGIRDVVASAGASMEIVMDAPALRDAIDRWPALVVIDLANPGWETPVRWARNQPHTRAIPIIAFGKDVDPAAARLACAIGCNHAWERCRLINDLPDLLHEVLHPPIRWVEGWDAPPPAALCCGVAQFNTGEYWECHETLEALWMAEQRPIRDLYQGILQVGVAFHHLQRRNYAGSIKMLRRGLPRLLGLPEVCQGVHVAQLSAAARDLHDHALALGPERISELDLTSLPRIVMAGCG